ncbi:ubiquinone biosynthesis accessory factor UbiJ [Spartinivicinus ruber]|uniref:ubiquinone biosynthesis accessory factor UbiJ n=1 Tax=Spartinivicinus ruber TaxID=2683272 RepID=UPI0013D529E6|nr:SCP2 sterol-binding domain-containing protein [Spartinivicinus ruber]
MASSIITTAAFASIETAINRILRLDPIALEQLAKLSGKTLCIQCTLPQLVIYLEPSAEGVRLKSLHEAEVTCCLSGTGPALLQLLVSQDKNNQLFGNSVQIIGSSDFAMQIQQILQNSQLDWEGWLAKYTGPVFAHTLGQSLRGGLSFAQKTANTFQKNLSEYLQEELRQLPSRNEVECFFDDLDELKLATDRLTARVKRLAEQLDKSTTSKNL